MMGQEGELGPRGMGVGDMCDLFAWQQARFEGERASKAGGGGGDGTDGRASSGALRTRLLMLAARVAEKDDDDLHGGSDATSSGMGHLSSSSSRGYGELYAKLLRDYTSVMDSPQCMLLSKFQSLVADRATGFRLHMARCGTCRILTLGVDLMACVVCPRLDSARCVQRILEDLVASLHSLVRFHSAQLPLSCSVGWKRGMCALKEVWLLKHV